MRPSEASFSLRISASCARLRSVMSMAAHVTAVFPSASTEDQPEDRRVVPYPKIEHHFLSPSATSSYDLRFDTFCELRIFCTWIDISITLSNNLGGGMAQVWTIKPRITQLQVLVENDHGRTPQRHLESVVSESKFLFRPFPLGDVANHNKRPGWYPRDNDRTDLAIEPGAILANKRQFRTAPSLAGAYFQCRRQTCIIWGNEPSSTALAEFRFCHAKHRACRRISRSDFAVRYCQKHGIWRTSKSERNLASLSRRASSARLRSVMSEAIPSIRIGRPVSS